MSLRHFFCLADRRSPPNKTARFNLYEMDCVECADDVYDIMTHQAGVREIITNTDGKFFTVAFDDTVLSVDKLMAVLEMFGYYPEEAFLIN